MPEEEWPERVPDIRLRNAKQPLDLAGRTSCADFSDGVREKTPG